MFFSRPFSPYTCSVIYLSLLPSSEICTTMFGSVGFISFRSSLRVGMGLCSFLFSCRAGNGTKCVLQGMMTGAEAPLGRNPSLVGLPTLELGRTHRWSLHSVGGCRLRKLKDTDILIVLLAVNWRGCLYLMSRIRTTPIPCAEQPQELNIETGQGSRRCQLHVVLLET